MLKFVDLCVEKPRAKSELGEQGARAPGVVVHCKKAVQRRYVLLSKRFLSAVLA